MAALFDLHQEELFWQCVIGVQRRETGPWAEYWQKTSWNRGAWAWPSRRNRIWASGAKRYKALRQEWGAHYTYWEKWIKVFRLESRESSQMGLEELSVELSYEKRNRGREEGRRRRDTIYYHYCGPGTLPTLSLFFAGPQKDGRYAHCFEEEVTS